MRNRGYGAAIRTGLQHSGKQLVFYTDADRQFDVTELSYFLPMMKDLDLVVGFRVYRYDRVLRSMISWVYNRIVRVLFRVRVRDVDCAFKLMRAEVRDKLSLETDDFFIDTEIVARARKWNFRIGEKGVRHYPRVAGETTVAPGDVIRTLQTIARMWRRIYMPSESQRDEADQICRSRRRPGAAADGHRLGLAMEEGFYAEYFEIEDRHWWFVGRRRIVLEILAAQTLSRRVGAEPEIVDLGCGTGAMLEHLRSFGSVRRARCRRARGRVLPGPRRAAGASCSNRTGCRWPTTRSIS